LVNWGKKNFEMRVKSGQKLHDCKEFSLAEASLSLDYATSERLVNRTLQ